LYFLRTGLAQSGFFRYNVSEFPMLEGDAAL